MKLTELAAYRVVERGLDYYLNDAVSDVMKTGTSEFEGKVIGGREEPYIVRVNLEKPRSSRCTCPYATGTNVCKHMIALYYVINPIEANEFVENRRLYEEYDDEDDNYDYDEYDSLSLSRRAKSYRGFPLRFRRSNCGCEEGTGTLEGTEEGSVAADVCVR